MLISLDRIRKSFGNTPVLRDVSLQIESQELFFLLGPSGCGKTTLLRLLAGFNQPDAGEIRFGERLMNEVPPHERNTGMVFQNYALWPHLSVAQNVAYGLEVRGISKAEITRRVGEALEVVQMGPYSQRTPNQLSGGQQQRVALARALVVKPGVLFLDEPLSNLDARLRLEMRDEIRRIHAQTRITTVYVTHDQKEALSLADRIAILRDGQVVQLGTPEVLYRTPVDRFVADFIGETNWVEGTMVSVVGEYAKIESKLGIWLAPIRPGISAPSSVWLGFRPESVRFDTPRQNTFSGLLQGGYYLGDVREYRLAIPDHSPMKAVEQNPDHGRPNGSAFSAWVRPEDVFILPR